MVKKLTLTALYFRAFTFPFRPIEFAVRGQALGKKQVQNIQYKCHNESSFGYRFTLDNIDGPLAQML